MYSLRQTAASQPERRPARRRPLCALVACSWLLVSGQAPSPEQRGRQIAEEADRRARGWGDYSVSVTMTLRSRQGQESRRALRVQALETGQDGDKNLVIVDSPPDVKGTALLIHSHARQSDDCWLYLPAVGRVKRIAAPAQSGPFLGSEFAYEDIGSQEVDDFRYRHLRDERYQGLECFVVERSPTAGDSGYTREVSWIDRQEYRPLRIDYYDRKNALLKTLTLSEYRQYLGRFWRAGKMLMVNHQSGKSTLLEWSDYRFRSGLRADNFSPDRLRSVR